jgi:NAD(P)H-dependent flavin oxidoreductase YrpB (nitropropane dioxygenase family)
MDDKMHTLPSWMEKGDISDLIQMPELKIGDLVARIPIIQGGMGVGISLSGLASAVANESAVGVISSTGIGMLETDFKTNFKEAHQRALRQEIRKAKERTDGLIGVNIMIAVTDYEALIRIVLEEHADFVFLGAGLPLKIPISLGSNTIKKSKTKFIPIVSSARAVKIIFQSWEKSGVLPDAVVVEGPLAGGHLGFKKEQIESEDFRLEKLLTEVMEVIQVFEHRHHKKIPVIAAGGIFSGEDIYKMIQLGVKGVQMATRFVATHECDADIKFKEVYIQSKKSDLEIINSPVGLPGRAIRNSFLRDVSTGVKKPFRCPWKCLRTCNMKEAPYCIALALTQAKLGNLENGFAFAGANVYRVEKIVSVKELIRSLLMEYNNAVLLNEKELISQTL